MDDYQTKLNDWKESLQRSIGVRDSLMAKRKRLLTAEENYRQDSIKATRALNFVEESVKSIRTKTLRSIEAVANEALQSIYEEDIKLECDFNIKRDRSAVTLRYSKALGDGTRVKRNPDGSGGGVSDVVTLSLRLVLIKATGCDPVLIADEPFKWVGPKRVEKAAELLKYLSEKLNIQMIVTSHHDVLRDIADCSHEIYLDEEKIVQVYSKGV